MNINKTLESYSINWNTPSENSGDSMPCGGHDIGLNVWVEKNDLLFYIDRSGSFDENHQMLKLGRIRARLTPNPFKGNQPFLQCLNLEKGHIEITAGIQKVKLILWVDVFSPTIHLKIESEQKIDAEVFYENWRRKPLEVKPEHRHATISLRQNSTKVYTWPDVIQPNGDGILFYHRNKSDDLLRDKLISQQGLDSVAKDIPDTQINRTFGGFLRGKNMTHQHSGTGIYIKTPFEYWSIKSTKPSHSHDISIHCHTSQSDNIEEWQNKLFDLTEKHQDLTILKSESEAWWKKYWSQHHIAIQKFENRNPSDPAWQVGRNYQLFRYMLGCNAMGEYPSKFNGSLFTFDPCHITGLRNSLADQDRTELTPDFRCWGGGSFTGQNQRLVYWPMLKSGDFNMMHSQFDYYLRALPGATARVKHYWGHNGCCFTEQLENFGLPFGWGYGWPDGDGDHQRTPNLETGLQAGKFIRYHYDSQVEFAFMILEYHRYSGRSIKRWLPFVRSVITFFDEHYRFRCKQASGKELSDSNQYIFAPSTSLETYKNATNPLPVITGLTVLLKELIQCDDDSITENDRSFAQQMLTRLPEIPTTLSQEHKVFSPAESFDPQQINSEDPQLYGVFPYPVVQPDNKLWHIAQNTWDYDDLQYHFDICWGQTEIWAAKLHRTEEAKELIVNKLQDATPRFPAFWGPGPDWVPDVDHGGAGMIGLQEMLMQSDQETIYILPSWPVDWDVDAKLNAPHKTTIELTVEKGSITRLNVHPKERINDIHINPAFANKTEVTN